MGKNVLVIILAGLFVGCSISAGHKYDVTAVDRIGVGQTTESDVVSMMGLPLAEKKLSNGTKVYSYAYGVRCPIWVSTKIDLAEIQVYNGIVINKWQEIMDN
jgi:hypothetical protein